MGDQAKARRTKGHVSLQPYLSGVAMVRKVLILSVFSILLSANLVWGATYNVTTAVDTNCSDGTYSFQSASGTLLKTIPTEV